MKNNFTRYARAITLIPDLTLSWRNNWLKWQIWAPGWYECGSRTRDVKIRSGVFSWNRYSNSSKKRWACWYGECNSEKIKINPDVGHFDHVSLRSAQPQWLDITQTRPCNMQRCLKAVKMTILDEKMFLFYYFAENILRVHVEAVLTSTHNQCFGAKISVPL